MARAPKCHVHQTTALRSQQAGRKGTIVALGIVSGAAEAPEGDTHRARGGDIDGLRGTGGAYDLRTEG
jgi:hypothetical protein